MQDERLPVGSSVFQIGDGVVDVFPIAFVDASCVFIDLFEASDRSLASM